MSCDNNNDDDDDKIKCILAQTSVIAIFWLFSCVKQTLTGQVNWVGMRCRSFSASIETRKWAVRVAIQSAMP